MNIVLFGSPGMVYRDPKKDALAKRAQKGLILGRSEETKGYYVYLLNDKKVVVTNHVKNVETLSKAQNASPLLESGVSDGTADCELDAAQRTRLVSPPWVEQRPLPYCPPQTKQLL